MVWTVLPQLHVAGAAEGEGHHPAGRSPKMVAHYSIYLINHAGILENLGSNMGQKSVLNQLLKPFRGLGSVRNGFAMYFSSRLSPSKLRTASKWSQNQSFPLNRSGIIKEKHPVLLLSPLLLLLLLLLPLLLRGSFYNMRPKIYENMGF